MICWTKIKQNYNHIEYVCYTFKVLKFRITATMKKNKHNQ